MDTNQKYLRLLSEKYPTLRSLTREIINLTAILNLPNGLDVKLNFDDKTMATQDMNRVIGRLYAAIGVVAPNAFAVATIS